MKAEDPRVRPEVNILHPQFLHHLSRHFPKAMRHNLIIQPVPQEERGILIRPVLGEVILDPVTEEQVTGETEDTAKFLLVRNTREDGHCAALREPTENNSRGFDALVDLLFDQSVEVVLRAQNAGFVLVADGVFEVELLNSID